MTIVRTAFVAKALSFAGAMFFAVPIVMGQSGDSLEATRVIDVSLSRFTFSPERIEVRLGERVRLNLTARDGAHGFQVKELGLNGRAMAAGQTVAIDLTPRKAGAFQITCSEYCGSGHTRMKAWLIVTPGT